MSDKCEYCGLTHPERKCTEVKAIEYHEDGKTIRRIEFFSNAEKSYVFWPTYIPSYPTYPYYPTYPNGPFYMTSNNTSVLTGTAPAVTSVSQIHTIGGLGG